MIPLSCIFAFSGAELGSFKWHGFIMVDRGQVADSFLVGLSVSDQDVKADGQDNWGIKRYLIVTHASPFSTSELRPWWKAAFNTDSFIHFRL